MLCEMRQESRQQYHKFLNSAAAARRSRLRQASAWRVMVPSAYRPNSEIARDMSIVLTLFHNLIFSLRKCYEKQIFRMST